MTEAVKNKSEEEKKPLAVTEDVLREKRASAETLYVSGTITAVVGIIGERILELHPDYKSFLTPEVWKMFVDMVNGIPTGIALSGLVTAIVGILKMHNSNKLEKKAAKTATVFD